MTWARPNESAVAQQAITTVASYICSSPTNCRDSTLDSRRYKLDVDRTSQGPLTVVGVTLADDGRYTCEVTALVGNGQSSTYLIVTSKLIDNKLKFDWQWQYFIFEFFLKNLWKIWRI